MSQEVRTKPYSESYLRRKNIPSRKKIIDYWANINHPLDDGQFAVKNGAYERCFACGANHRRLERAHIVPARLGGTVDCSNLHILCNICHLESEKFETADSYWKWYEYKINNDYDMGFKELAMIMKVNNIYDDESFAKYYGISIKELEIQKLKLDIENYYFLCADLSNQLNDIFYSLLGKHLFYEDDLAEIKYLHANDKTVLTLKNEIETYNNKIQMCKDKLKVLKD
jgi:hypothetical protein